MTKDEALTMIIASIAMEELALSHIINAEGEKLQYVLGTLPGSGRNCASTQEILAVNKSVTDLLDTVMQSQMLLKGKLERTLEAGGHMPAPAPKPTCPCGPPKPCGPVKPEGPTCGCGRPWDGKSAIHLTCQRGGLTWENGVFLPWKCQSQKGGGIRWDEKKPAVVSLDPKKIYALHYIIDTCGPYSGDGRGKVAVKLSPGSAFSDIPPLHFSVKCPEDSPLTLHCAAMLFPQNCPVSWADLSLLLHYRDGLFVEKASLSIVEV